MKNKKILVIFFVIFFILGITTALSFRHLRYTTLLSPVIIDVEPKLVYESIEKKSEKSIFIDVRSEYEYNQAHASGSINLPIHHMYDDTHGLKNGLGVLLPKNTDQEIYLICTGGRLAGVAYSYLEHYGYRNIKRVKGGINNWNAEGYPVITKSLFDKSYIEKSYNLNQSPLDKPYVNTKNN